MNFIELNLSPKPSAESEEIAILYSDDGNPVREHILCYHTHRGTGSNTKNKYYSIFSMASEDTDYYEYNGKPPHKRDLNESTFYKVENSVEVSGYDQDHIVICLLDKTIEIVGLTYGISATSIKAGNAKCALLKYLGK